MVAGLFVVYQICHSEERGIYFLIVQIFQISPQPVLSLRSIEMTTYFKSDFISCNFNKASTGVSRFISTASSNFLISLKVAECASKMLSCILGVFNCFMVSSTLAVFPSSRLSSSCFKISFALSINDGGIPAIRAT